MSAIHQKVVNVFFLYFMCCYFVDCSNLNYNHACKTASVILEKVHENAVWLDYYFEGARARLLHVR